MRIRSFAAAAAAASILLLAGCSGSSSDGGKDTTTTAAAGDATSTPESIPAVEDVTGDVSSETTAPPQTVPESMPETTTTEAATTTAQLPPGSIPADQLGAVVAARVGESLGLTLYGQCDGPLVAAQGESQSCTVSTGTESKALKITVTSVEGSTLNYGIESAG